MKNTITVPRGLLAETEFTVAYTMTAEAHVLDVILTILKWYMTAPWWLIGLDAVWMRLLGPLLAALVRPRLSTRIEQWLWARRGLPTCSVDVQ